MDCNFHVGQKVVLVRPFGRISYARAMDEGISLPIKGRIYTIREFDDQLDMGGALALRLNEIINTPCENGLEPSFCVSLFEAVVERPTDISIFKAMLTPKTEQVPA